MQKTFTTQNFKSMITRLTRINKWKYFKNLFSEYKTNSKQTWKSVGSLINIKMIPNKRITFLNISSQTDTNLKTISEAVNELSPQVLKILINKIIPTSKAYKDYLKMSVLN